MSTRHQRQRGGYGSVEAVLACEADGGCCDDATVTLIAVPMVGQAARLLVCLGFVAVHAAAKRKALAADASRRRQNCTWDVLQPCAASVAASVDGYPAVAIVKEQSGTGEARHLRRR